MLLEALSFVRCRGRGLDLCSAGEGDDPKPPLEAANGVSPWHEKAHNATCD